MKITAIKTKRIQKNDDLFQIITSSIPKLPENSIIAITSKIVSLCNGDFRPIEGTDKKLLRRSEADYWTPAELKDFDLDLSIKNGILILNAGIDESNADNSYVLWPKNIQKVTNDLWAILRSHYKIKNLGIIVTDSTVPPLRVGTIGIALSYCGFDPIKNYVGQKDLFGREIKLSVLNIKDNLASAAILAMGEGAESTPLAIIEEAKLVTFKNSPPSKSEIESLKIEKENDIFQKFFRNIDWEEGGAGVLG